MSNPSTDSEWTGFNEWINLENIAELSPDQYLLKLQQAWQKLEEIGERNFPRRIFVLEICLSVKAQLKIENLTQPFALFLLANPSTKKSTILDIVNGLPGCYKSDKFTPKSFVSHSASVSRKDLQKIDLLPKVRHKTFITPELAPLFSSDQDNLVDNFGILTRVLDGRGLKTESGVHGQRGYEGDYYFMWLGAVVDIPHRVWRILGNLGSRWYFYRLPEETLNPKEKKAEIKKSFKEKPYIHKLEECQKACRIFWAYVACNPQMNKDGKIEWNTIQDDDYTHDKIIEIAMLLSKLRGTVPTWHTYDSNSSGSNYNFEMPKIEDPERASNALYNLARGHALLYGRNYITKDDLAVVVSVALSSAQKERVSLFNLLLEKNGELTTEQFVELSGVSANTARKHMQMLKILGIVNFYTDGNYKIILKEEYGWFLSDEFKRYWTNSLHTPKNSASQQTLDAEKKGVSGDQEGTVPNTDTLDYNNEVHN